MSAPRVAALRELAGEAELERRDFVYEATEQLRRFLDANRERLREIGPIKLVDDEQDYLLFDPVDQVWTTRLTYQDPADSEWYDEEQTVEAVSEVVELYNLADILSWFVDAAASTAMDFDIHFAPLTRQVNLLLQGTVDPSWSAAWPMRGFLLLLAGALALLLWSLARRNWYPQAESNRRSGLERAVS